MSRGRGRERGGERGGRGIKSPRLRSRMRTKHMQEYKLVPPRNMTKESKRELKRRKESSSRRLDTKRRRKEEEK